MTNSNLDSVVELYKYHFRQASPVVRPLAGAGGYSGAEFWKIVDGEESYCLRRWPPSFQDEEKLNWIHQVIMYAAADGCEFLPVPLRADGNQTWCKSAGCFWQLDPWVRGTASYWTDPNDEKLANAAQALARWHNSTTSFRQPSQPSASIQRRCDLLQEMLDGKSGQPSGVSQIEHFCSQRIDADLYDIGVLICDRFRKLAPVITDRLHQARNVEIQPQPCLADIWHDHVFFTGNRVTGIIDFGAMQYDSPTLDVARLLGSLVEDDTKKWDLAIAEYEKDFPLTESDRILVSVFDQSTTLLSGMNWLRWIFVERRAFDEMGSIAERLRRIARRMDHLIAID